MYSLESVLSIVELDVFLAETRESRQPARRLAPETGVRKVLFVWRYNPDAQCMEYLDEKGNVREAC